GISYKRAGFAEEVRGVTGKRGVYGVVDGVGGESWMRSLACLARGGRLVTCGATAGANPRTDVRRIFWNHLKIFGSILGTREDFGQVLNFLEFTRTKPIIDRVFSLGEASAAQMRMVEGKQFGKSVLRVED